MPGERGRPRIPTAVKERQGTLEASRTSPAEPEWPQASEVPPTWLKGEAAAAWRRLVPLLLAQGLFPATARDLLAGVCQAWGRWREAECALAREGKVFTTSTGYQSQSPWIAIGNKAWAEYVSGCSRFGLDPASAGKVVARPQGTDKDELAKARAARKAAR